MTHTEPSRKFQPRSMFSTWIGMVLLFAFFGLLVLVVINASPRGNNYEEKRAKARVEKLQAVQEEKTKALTTYAWIDKSKGVVRIPIAEAMKLTVAELATKVPVSANPIATPPPAPAAPTTTGAAPPAAETKPATSSSVSPSPSTPATPPAHEKTP